VCLLRGVFINFYQVKLEAKKNKRIMKEGVKSLKEPVTKVEELEEE